MKFIKETIFIITALFTSRPSKYDLLELRESKYYPLGYKAMSWCGRLLYHGTFEPWYDDKTTWTHENIHLYQAKTHFKTWIGYYISYAWSVFVGIFYMWSWDFAYYTCKWETEAYAKDGDQSYLMGYTKSSISKYTMKLSERKKLWKSVGKDRRKWKELIKTL